MIRLDYSMTSAEVSQSDIKTLSAKASQANKMLHDGTGAGADYLGWVSLPSEITEGELRDITTVADRLRWLADVVVVIGIGGSYLGSKAVIESLGNQFSFLKKKQDSPHVVFAGNNISEDYMYDLLDALRERSIAAIVISKSGTTTEPAIAFRLIRAEIERRYGKNGAQERIVAITDRSRGALKTMANKQGYKSFIIPDNVGGRYSVLTPVGLLPMAVAGIDIAEIVKGARDMQEKVKAGVPFSQNMAEQYAVIRNALYSKGYNIEILGSYEPTLQYIGEWWKQLYGESEGKEGKGIFPASVTLTADLHSMGQYIQDGERRLFETIISVTQSDAELTVSAETEDLDGLNFMTGKRLTEINHMAEMGVSLAHADGGVPNIRIEMPQRNAYYIGALLYFFEKACGISGYMLGVNPFDQPGVEAYKKNMFALLDKPGHEEAGKELRRRLHKDK